MLDKAVEITREGGDTDIGAGVKELGGEVAVGAVLGGEAGGNGRVA